MDEPLLKNLNAGTASFQSSAANLIVNILGVGVLTTAWAFKQTSIISGLLLFTFFCVCNLFSFCMIARCCDGCASFSYLEIGRSILGPKSGVLLQSIILVHAFFSCVSYIIFLGDLLPEAISSAYPDCWGLSDSNFRALIIVSLALVVLTPLALVNKLEFLKYTSYGAIGGIAFLSFVVIARFLDNPADAKPAAERNVQMFEMRSCLLPTLPMFSLAFCAHFNAPQIYMELQARSVARFTKVAATALGVCWLVNVVVAVLGYMTWGDDVSKILLDNYKLSPSGGSDPLALALKWVFSLVISWTVPGMFFALKNAFFSLLYPTLDRGSSLAMALSLLLLYSTVFIGILVRDITALIVYLGALTGSSIVYIIPATLCLKVAFQGTTRIEGELYSAAYGTLKGDSLLSDPFDQALKPRAVPRAWGFWSLCTLGLLLWGIAVSVLGILFEALTQMGVLDCP